MGSITMQCNILLLPPIGQCNSVVPVHLSHYSSSSSSGTLIPSIIVPVLVLEPDSFLFMVLVPVLELFFSLY